MFQRDSIFAYENIFFAQKLILKTCLKYFHANSGPRVCSSDERLRIWFKVFKWNPFQLVKLYWESSKLQHSNAFAKFPHDTFLEQPNPVNTLAKSLPLPPTYGAAWFKIKCLSFVPVRWTIRFLNVFHVVLCGWIYLCKLRHKSSACSLATSYRWTELYQRGTRDIINLMEFRVCTFLSSLQINSFMSSAVALMKLPPAIISKNNFKDFKPTESEKRQSQRFQI